MEYKEPTIKIKSEVRPCKIDDKRALFHRWIEEDSVIFKFNTAIKHETLKEALRDMHEHQYCPYCAEVEKIKRNFALVEYEDGTVTRVHPEKVVFLDDEVNIFFSQNYTKSEREEKERE